MRWVLWILLLVFVPNASLAQETIRMGLVQTQDNEQGILVLGTDLYTFGSDGALTRIVPTSPTRKEVVESLASLGEFAGIPKALVTILSYIWDHFDLERYTMVLWDLFFGETLSREESAVLTASSMKRHKGHLVARRDGLIDTKVRCFATTSCTQMLMGRPPFDNACQLLALRLVGRSLIVEMTEEEARHSQGKHLHDLALWERVYWKERRYGLCP